MLGTVQFGLDYGVSNKSGQVEFKEAEAMLQLAFKEDILSLDTAHAYGSSEEVIGSIPTSTAFGIYTKLPSLSGDLDEALASCEHVLKHSLKNLRFER